MEPRRKVTMSWEGLDEINDDDELFFETRERMSSAVPLDLASSSGEEDENFEDSRMSFASCISSVQSFKAINVSNADSVAAASTAAVNPEYDIWMAAPDSIRERRRRLLLGMGLDENKDSAKFRSFVLDRVITKKFENSNNAKANSNDKLSPSSSSSPVPATTATKNDNPVSEKPKTEPPRSSVSSVLSRSRSEGDIDVDSLSMGKRRKEEFIGKISKQRLTRTSTEIVASRAKTRPPYQDGSRIGKDSGAEGQSQRRNGPLPNSKSDSWGAFFLIKNLDTGKEFIVNEYGEDGMWNRLSDIQTGKQLTKEEFEKTVGHSPVVTELMRRENVGSHHHHHDGHDRKLLGSKSISKSLRILSKRGGVAMLKSIKGVASGYFGESQREREAMAALPGFPSSESKPGKNDWVRVRQSGKSYKELSALHLSQEIQAHEGCIWTIKFSFDGHYLASAGEDKVIHVWEVQECEVMSLRPEEGNFSPIHPSLLASNGQPESPSLGCDKKKKKGKLGSKRVNLTPDYVHMPETVFSLNDKPVCSFHGHLDDVLDLSWSKSNQLLSSSMDKTVRLWDLESQACLKLFAHNDYVTCVQFNPVNEDHFISGSLDAKVRIWNIPDRQVVDWVDVHEMVTAVSYTPDAQTALVGTHKGTLRTYAIEDCQLGKTSTIELRRKKKSHLRKVTGFQFAPGNPSQALVTSADSRIRLVDDSGVVQKFKGFKNGNSQMAASFSHDGRYIISASEDSQVHLWKCDDHRHGSSGKGKGIIVTQAHEYFSCKDVSAAIFWPCTIKGDPPPVPINSKRQPKRSASAPQATSTCGSPSKDDNTPKISKRLMLPPLPKKNPNPSPEITPTSPEEDPAAISWTQSGIGDSFRSVSASSQFSDSASLSSSMRYGGIHLLLVGHGLTMAMAPQQLIRQHGAWSSSPPVLGAKSDASRTLVCRGGFGRATFLEALRKRFICNKS
ncbi:hypothetical protein L6164_003308 [Bauhinia variegata]|uniref:Uncharacterized protein n=1 Tax=Bauhinia variegata TaxID=167791 RepID=A0ACB9Q105_BAUVA|nr:hypothetical protein L6164_003308 [Bauhinia variegata]